MPDDLVSPDHEDLNHLFESEQRFRSWVNQSLQPLQLHDLKGRLLYVNPSWDRLWRVRNSDRFYKRYNLLSDAQSRKLGIKRAFRKALKGKTATAGPVLFKPRESGLSGRDRWINSTVYPLFNDAGDVINIVLTHDDITDKINTETALKESESLFRQVWESSFDGMRILDHRGTILMVNDAFCTITGLNRENLIGKPYHIIYANPDSDHMLRSFRDRFEHGNILPYFEHLSTLKNGRQIWFEVSNSYLKGSGKNMNLLSVFRDITERKRVESALRESEELYKTLVETMPDGVLVIGLDGKIEYASPSAVRLHGYDSAKELVGRDISDTNLPEKRKAFRKLFQKHLKTDAIHNFEMVTLRKDNSKFLVEVHATLIKDQNGSPSGLLATSRDITAKHEADKALRESEEKYRHIFENIQDVYYETSIDGNVIEISPSIYEMSGYTREEVLGLSSEQFYHDKAERQKFIETIIRDGKVVDFKVTLTDKQGSNHLVSLNAILYTDPQGNPIKIIGSIRDKTESMKLENQLQQAQKMEAVGTLAGGVAHDFNNILTAIIGSADLAMEQIDDSSPVYGRLKSIREAGQRASDLTSQLLAFSRKQVLEAKILSVNDVIKDLQRILLSLIRDDIEIVTHFESLHDFVKADKTQLEHVLINLAINASDAMPEGGTITIETRDIALNDDYARTHPTVRPGRYVQIAVSDSGQGMDKETREKIFDPFFTTKEVGKGTGLGLAMVYGIVKQHGGNIWVYSEPGIGTTFKIYLPYVNKPGETKQTEKPSAKITGGDETILVVEDEDFVKELVCDSLSNVGYRILKADDVYDAIEIAEQHKNELKLLITDMIMPGMNGLQLYKKISTTCSELGVIYMSGYTNNVISDHGFIEKGLHFMQKPFVIEELLRKVRDVLNGSS